MPDWRKLEAFLDTYPAFSKEGPTACAEFWHALPPPEWGDMLIEVLTRYRRLHQQRVPLEDQSQHGLSCALNELASVCYSLQPQLTEEHALAVLRTSFHTCGHGTDTRPPLDLALQHFDSKPYTPELFEAARAYRKALSHSRAITAQALKTRIEFILWQDWNNSRKWKTCWATHIRASITAMPAAERVLWSALFQRFSPLPWTTPQPQWREACLPALERIPAGAFSQRVIQWMGQPSLTARPAISTPATHALKNLIWCAAFLQDAELDRSFMSLVDIRWKCSEPMNKVAGALAWLWSLRAPTAALPFLERLYHRYGYPGGKIQDHYRNALRAVSGPVPSPATSILSSP
ncbi:MAG: hypothetical protein J0L64_12020 [Acidobacteria bacterium]|nr:hypothetical protein [Acidobacteriota bacterium]